MTRHAFRLAFLLSLSCSCVSVVVGGGILTIQDLNDEDTLPEDLFFYRIEAGAGFLSQGGIVQLPEGSWSFPAIDDVICTDPDPGVCPLTEFISPLTDTNEPELSDPNTANAPLRMSNISAFTRMARGDIKDVGLRGDIFDDSASSSSSFATSSVSNDQFRLTFDPNGAHTFEYKIGSDPPVLINLPSDALELTITPEPGTLALFMVSGSVLIVRRR